MDKDIEDHLKRCLRKSQEQTLKAEYQDFCRLPKYVQDAFLLGVLGDMLPKMIDDQKTLADYKFSLGAFAASMMLTGGKDL